MATFIGCKAEGNGLGGFKTVHSSSVFIACKAINNGEPGFEDCNVDELRNSYLSEFEKLKRHIDSINSLSKEQKLAIKTYLGNITDELKKEKPKADTVSKIFSRLKEITREHIGEIVAKSIFELVSRAPELIHQLSQAGPIS